MSQRNSSPTISAQDLAERLALGDRLQVLDVRQDASWGIEAAGLERLHHPAAAVLEDPAKVAAEIHGEVAVVCGRGQTAEPVARALRDNGVEARVLEGGMRAWIAELQARAVDVGIPGLTVLQIQRPGRGCLSYLLATQGRALVVDPAPGPAYYLSLAASLGAEVTDVVDTHIHADHLSGARALASASGAVLRLPQDSLVRGINFAEQVEPLHDGDTIALGEVDVRAVALPGHTTDMTGLLVGGRALLGGDSVFADGIARPDLQRGDPAGARSMARDLHATLTQRVRPLGQDVVLLPGHAHPGVASGAIAPTLGQVWGTVPELGIADPDAFAERILAGMPPRPDNHEAIIAANSGYAPPDPELESGPNSCATR